MSTSNMQRANWAKLLDRCIHDIRSYNFYGRILDLRENIKYPAGQMARWLHNTFPQKVCVLSIEVKKFFLDEWTGPPDWEQIVLLQDLLQSCIPGIVEELGSPY